MPAPRIAIVLLNYNGWRDTLECLDSVAQLDYPNFLTVICDNASTDESVDRIRGWCGGERALEYVAEPRRDQLAAPARREFRLTELDRAQAEAGRPLPPDPEIVLLHNGGNLGFAEGNNVGLRYLLGVGGIDYVWILNNDTVVDRHCLTALVDCASAASDLGGVGAAIYEYREPDRVQVAGGGVFSRLHPNPGVLTRGIQSPLEFLAGTSMLVPMRALERAGLFDESFYIYCEDVDLSVRIRAAGLKLLYAPAAKLWHKGGTTFGHRSLRHDYYTVRNTLAVVRKHYPLMTPVIALYLAYRAGAPKIVRRQWSRLRASWLGFRDFTRRVGGPAPI